MAYAAGQLQNTIRRLLHDKVFVTGLSVILFMVFVGLTADFLAPYPKQGLLGIPSDDILRPPSLEHPFGTTHIGRDIISTVMFGARTSLLLAVEVEALNLLIGISLGLMAGYYGGKIDEIVMRVTDVFLGFPHILLSLLIVATIGPGFNSVLIAIGATWWPWHARLSRSQALILKGKGFVLASKASGVRNIKVLFRHVLPNAIPPEIMQATQDFGSVILAAAGLSFLGLGLLEPTPDWGLMISSSRAYFPINWWFATFPGLALFATVMGFSLMGDGVREHLDPRLRKRSLFR